MMEMKDLFMVLGFIVTLVVTIVTLNNFRDNKLERMKTDIWGAISTFRDNNMASHTGLIQDYSSLLTKVSVMQEKILNYAEMNNNVNRNLESLDRRVRSVEKLMIKVGEKLNVEMDDN